MATSSNICLSPAVHVGVLNVPGVTSESAKAASDVLTDNHHTHHIFYNNDGFHNHIVHHALAQYDLGAPPSLIREAYKANSSYQRPIDVNAPSKAVLNLSDLKSRGKQQYYSQWLRHFQGRIDEVGWEATVNETLFSRTEDADDMLVRLFAGFLHPFIHLGYAMEFQQPALVAEALAMAAISDSWMKPLFEEAGKAAAGTEGEGKTMVELLKNIRADEKLRMSPRWEDGNKVKGVLERAGEEMVGYAACWKVTAEEERFAKKVAELINAAALFTGASQREDKQIKIDFYYMHSHNSSIFLPTIIAQPWMSVETKARLLEWKGRVDLALYASRRAPELRVDDIRHYIPKAKDLTNPWFNIFHRALKLEDDGHLIKLLRALAVGEKLCQPYQDHEKEGFVMKGDMWINMGHMAVDSAEDSGCTGQSIWARSVGFDEAWEKYGPRVKYGERAQL